MEKTEWIDFLVEDEGLRSSTSICFRIADPWYAALPEEEQTARVREVAALLEEEGVAYDIGAYREAPPGLRIWGGSTVETGDIEVLTRWLDWAFYRVKNDAQ